MKKAYLVFAGVLTCLVVLQSFNSIPTFIFDIAPAPPSICGSPSNKFVLRIMDTTRQLTPLFNGLGSYSMKVTSPDAKAKKYFDQGLNLYYGFNHLEAYRSFKEAARLDASFAMAYWGQALALGPNINAAMDAADAGTVYEAVQKALSLKSVSSLRDQMLIDAISNRYTKEAPADRTSLDLAYAEAMRGVYQKFSKDADVITLFTESLMDLHPWDYWNKEGTPKKWTTEITVLIDQALEVNVNHPGANHLVLHVYEASSFPEKAMPSADRLESLMPGAGHMVHMPSHIYIRTGRYADGTKANERAVKQDEAYIEQCDATGIYPLMYYPHNIHFIWACASLEGDSKAAIQAADRLAEKTDTKLLRTPGWAVLQHYKLTPLYARVRFGKWDDILKMANPVEGQKYPEAITTYARGLAFIRTNNLGEAREQLGALQALCLDESLDQEKIIGINSVRSVMKIASLVLAGELEAATGNYKQAIGALKSAMDMEDALIYQEPYDWHQPVRQVLGSVLLESGDAVEAEKYFREDLKMFKDNGWSLTGLKASLLRQGRAAEAHEIDIKLKNAFARADVKLTSARL
jgi:tetratricopeptide (TPR) repeat protein